jgi:hypothetical protein
MLVSSVRRAERRERLETLVISKINACTTSERYLDCDHLLNINDFNVKVENFESTKNNLTDPTSFLWFISELALYSSFSDAFYQRLFKSELIANQDVDLKLELLINYALGTILERSFEDVDFQYFLNCNVSSIDTEALQEFFELFKRRAFGVCRKVLRHTILRNGCYWPIMAFFAVLHQDKLLSEGLKKFVVKKIEGNVNSSVLFFFDLLVDTPPFKVSMVESYRIIKFYPLSDFVVNAFSSNCKKFELSFVTEKNTNIIPIRTSSLIFPRDKVRYTEEAINNSLPRKSYKLTFITSMFKGDFWVEKFMANMVSLDGFADTELIVFNENSPGNEDEIMFDYAKKFENVTYVKLDYDPGLYEIWNIGCKVARSDLLSNANLDDRKRADFITEHLRYFNVFSDVSVVSAPCFISKKPHEIPEDIEINREKNPLSFYTSRQLYSFKDLFTIKHLDGNRKITVPRNIPHCMPVWKKSLHQDYGYFDENFGGPTADYEFWLRIAVQGEKFANINVPLGVYYYSDTTTYSARNISYIDKINDLHIGNSAI